MEDCWRGWVCVPGGGVGGGVGLERMGAGKGGMERLKPSMRAESGGSCGGDVALDGGVETGGRV